MTRTGDVIRAVRARLSETAVGAALAAVAFASGFISYTHISALTQDLGGSWKTAHLMPLAVDGQIVIGSIYFMENQGRRRRWFGLLGFLPGVGESLFANWESGIVHGLLAAGWSTVPAQAFACSAFLFERWLHARKEAREQAAGQVNLLAVVRAEADGLRAALAAAADLDAVAAALAKLAPTPQAALEPERAAPATPAARQPAGWPLAGLPLPLLGKPARPDRAAPRPTAVPDAGDDRLPLPADEAQLCQVVRAAASARELSRTHQVTKHTAQILRKKYLDEDSENVA